MSIQKKNRNNFCLVVSCCVKFVVKSGFAQVILVHFQLPLKPGPIYGSHPADDPGCSVVIFFKLKEHLISTCLNSTGHMTLILHDLATAPNISIFQQVQQHGFRSLCWIPQLWGSFKDFWRRKRLLHVKPSVQWMRFTLSLLLSTTALNSLLVRVLRSPGLPCLPHSFSFSSSTPACDCCCYDSILYLKNNSSEASHRYHA